MTGATVAAQSPVIRRGATADGVYSLVIAPETAGWKYSGLRVLELPAGGTITLHTGPDELIVLPLSGGCVVACDGERFELAGRDSVFARVTDFAYVPRAAEVTISTVDGGRFALPAARATRRLPARYGAAEDVSIELRGAGQASRQINNFFSADAFEADRLIAVEVLTPGGNWSSYPPHKHDTLRSGVESVLEEIYYFEVASPGPAPGMGYQRVYGTLERPIEVCTEVRTGDVVLVPHGWHGPSIAAPGYDLYYLNVMAGPGERVWHYCFDPEHAWVRDTWIDKPIDPRLPMTTAQHL
jgi:5-deoxy-glucuronate isomerase